MPGCLLHPCSGWGSMFCAEPSKPASLVGVSVLYIVLCYTGWAELLLAHYVLVDGPLGTCCQINCQQSQQLDSLPAPQSTTFCFNQVKLLCPSLTTEPCPKSIAKAPEQHQGTRGAQVLAATCCLLTTGCPTGLGMLRYRHNKSENTSQAVGRGSALGQALHHLFLWIDSVIQKLMQLQSLLSSGLHLPVEGRDSIGQHRVMV